MQWHVCVKGPDLYLPMFPTAFSARELRIDVGEEGLYFLTSSHLDGIADLDAAKAKGYELVEALNGLAQLIWPGFAPKCFASYLLGIRADGSEVRAIMATVRIAVVVGGDVEGVHELILDRGADHFPGQLRPEIASTLSEPLLRDALRVYGAEVEPTWTNLYKTLELLERWAGGNHQLLAKGGVSRNSFERFRASANSWNASGLEARHAQDWQPPPNAMSLLAARTFVRRILAKCLRSFS